MYDNVREKMPAMSCISWHKKQKGLKLIVHIWDNTSVFLHQYVTYCSLILGPQTLGQHLDLQMSAAGKAGISKES
jgi:hypothetical protein